MLRKSFTIFLSLLLMFIIAGQAVHAISELEEDEVNLEFAEPAFPDPQMGESSSQEEFDTIVELKGYGIGVNDFDWSILEGEKVTLYFYWNNYQGEKEITHVFTENDLVNTTGGNVIILKLNVGWPVFLNDDASLEIVADNPLRVDFGITSSKGEAGRLTFSIEIYELPNTTINIKYQNSSGEELADGLPNDQEMVPYYQIGTGEHVIAIPLSSYTTSYDLRDIDFLEEHFGEDVANDIIDYLPESVLHDFETIPMTINDKKSGNLTFDSGTKSFKYLIHQQSKSDPAEIILQKPLNAEILSIPELIEGQAIASNTQAVSANVDKMKFTYKSGNLYGMELDDSGCLIGAPMGLTWGPAGSATYERQTITFTVDVENLPTTGVTIIPDSVQDLVITVPILRDTDGDGEPDITDNDDDGDGVPDEEEIKQGLDPKAPNYPSKLITLIFDYNLRDGTSEQKIIKARKNETITIPDGPVRDGYKFLYWKGSEYYPGDKYKVIEDHTFEAQWEPIPEPSRIPEITIPESIKPSSTTQSSLVITAPSKTNSEKPSSNQEQIQNLPATGERDSLGLGLTLLNLGLAVLVIEKRRG